MNPAFLKAASNTYLKKVIEEGRAGTQMTAWKTAARRVDGPGSRYPRCIHNEAQAGRAAGTVPLCRVQGRCRTRLGTVQDPLHQ